MYRRIFPIRSVQIGSIILGGAVMAWLVSALLVAVLQCNPPAKMWDDTIPGFCLDPLAVLVGPGVPNILTDIFILALPVKPILDLHVSFGRKMLIVFTFLTGFLWVSYKSSCSIDAFFSLPLDLLRIANHTIAWWVLAYTILSFSLSLSHPTWHVCQSLSQSSFLFLIKSHANVK